MHGVEMSRISKYQVSSAREKENTKSGVKIKVVLFMCTKTRLKEITLKSIQQLLFPAYDKDRSVKAESIRLSSL